MTEIVKNVMAGKIAIHRVLAALVGFRVGVIDLDNAESHLAAFDATFDLGDSLAFSISPKGEVGDRLAAQLHDLGELADGIKELRRAWDGHTLDGWALDRLGTALDILGQAEAQLAIVRTGLEACRPVAAPEEEARPPGGDQPVAADADAAPAS